MSNTKYDLLKANLLSPTFDGVTDIYMMLYELYITTFKWINLPDEIDSKHVERFLVEQGHCFFFEDKNLSTEDKENFYLMLTGALTGLNYYGEPTRIDIITPTNKTFTGKVIGQDGILMYNTYGGYPPQRRLMQFAERIYNLERTIDLNVYAQRYPIIGQGTQQAVNNILSFMDRVDDYRPLIIADSQMDLDVIKSHDFKAPFVADQLTEIKRKLWNEVLSFIGIENNASEKKERLTDDEVIMSNGLAIAFRNNRKIARLTAIDKINDKYGLNIQIEANTLEQAMKGINGEGDLDVNAGGDSVE